MNYSFNGWKSPAVRPSGVVLREPWWPVMAHAAAAEEIPGRVMGDFLFMDGKAYAIEYGNKKELRLWK